MRIAFLILIIAVLSSHSLCSRVNITKMIADLVPTISYEVYAGYEDIDEYMQPSDASVFYTLWESSTRRFTDHSTPLIFYLAGGPGLSSQYTAFRQFGPIQIDYDGNKFKGSENPWSWNYYAHLVFVDQPVGTGFSYNKNTPVNSSKVAAQHFVNFAKNFFKNSPFGLGANPIYLAGEGYAGHYIPAIASIVNSNSYNLGNIGQWASKSRASF